MAGQQGSRGGGNTRRQNYAPQGYPPPQNYAAPASSGSSADALLLRVAGMVMAAALVFGGGFWFGQSSGGDGSAQRDTAAVMAENQELLKTNKTLREQLKNRQDYIANLRKQLADNSQPHDDNRPATPELTFYEALPNQQVAPTSMKPTPASAAQPEAAANIGSLIEQELRKPTAEEQAAAAQGYRVQIGSFQRRSDAEMAAEKYEATSGVSLKIQESTLPDVGKRYRVYAGPFSSVESAQQAARQIESKLKIKGMLLHGT